VFEIMAGKTLIFSKKQIGRFPEDGEVFTKLNALTAPP